MWSSTFPADNETFSKKSKACKARVTQKFNEHFLRDMQHKHLCL